MIVNKKFDRFKQWAGEKMGGEVKTNTSDNFKALEMEMNLRHEGMEKLHKSMSLYIKTLAKKNEGDDREKMLPIGFLGSTMVNHGQDFQHDSEFGSCLISLGRANEALARRQESYVASATTTWLESLERSLAQMKEYQAARKKLEARRLAFDASLAKTQKAKKEDFRIEEELRAQKAKYEESSEDVYRRMEDIKEAEVESVADLTQFLEAELAYYDSCRDILLQFKRQWPASQPRHDNNDRRSNRPRSNTAHSYPDRFSQPEEDVEPTPKVTIPKLSSRTDSFRSDHGSNRSGYNRSVMADSGASSPRDYSPHDVPRISRTTTEPSGMLVRTALRSVPRHDDYDAERRSPDRYYNNDRSDSPTTSSHGSTPSRTTSWSTADTMPLSGTNPAIAKKGPPPPPPSRTKKPPPPAPPMKRAAVSAGLIPGSLH